jgi:hypothetical protein
MISNEENVSMKKMDKAQSTETGDFAYRGLYRASAIAALMAAVLFRRNLDAEWMLLRGTGIINVGPSTTPNTVIDWFMLLQHNKLLGLTLLNLFDLINYALVGLIFMALCTALRRASPSRIIIVAALGFAGITSYFVSNQSFTMLSLSQQYIAATSDAQRAMFLAAGQAALAIHQNNSYAGSGIYLSFLLVSVAGLIISAVMLHSAIFSKGTAYMGIMANGFGLGYYIVFAFAPALVFIPISISAVFLLVWYILVGVRLWVLDLHRITGALRAAASSDGGVLHKDNISQPL